MRIFPGRKKFDTEDVLQETYVSIAENAASYHGGNKAMAWIFRIARNFILMHFRKEKNKDSIHEVEEAVDAKYSFSFVENADHRMLLESAMEILEEEERQILFLHAVAGWKNREIAEYLGKNLNTVLSKFGGWGYLLIQRKLNGRQLGGLGCKPGN